MYSEARKRLVNWLRNQLIGPASDGELRISPLERYPTGVLHPIDPGLTGIDPALASVDSVEPNLQDELGDDDRTELPDQESTGSSHAQPVRRRRYVPPSSVGFSCFVRGNVSLSVTASAAEYRDNEERRKQARFLAAEFSRNKLPEATISWSVTDSSGEASESLWEAKAGIDIRARRHQDGFILTITLCNRCELTPNVLPNLKVRERVKKSLFEARLECVVESGELVDYPRVDPSLLTEEEQELELQYREQRIYAVGHGAAADWDVSPGRAAKIWSEFMPDAEVPLMTVNIGGDETVLQLSRLAKEPMIRELERFIDGYANWVSEQQHVAADFQNAAERAAASRITKRMEIALGRMRRCLQTLRSDPLVAESFRLANQAMLDQMRRGDFIAGQDREPEDYRWRPFQLAFLLTVLNSAVDENDDYRDVLDLIWFPTGGGKTEAYLGLIAFLIVWRRLKFPESGAGTSAFMRYTLRLLTRQQFERAARMICALELIRRRNPARLGETPIDIGIWVGDAISPNRFTRAKEIVEKIRNGRNDARYELLLERCSWCGTPFNAKKGYEATDEAFHFHCIEPDCQFGGDSGPLPCNVVDEALYEQPPSLLIGTIDKFARLAWDERTGKLFGVGTRSRPPELVIQDELHLITGPLGSVAGLYEAGIDTLLIRRGVRPKFIASTATIRMAQEQVRRLYARDLAVFPPSGLSHDNSYFARTDNERPGRLYVGYLAPMLDQQHCMSPLAAALLAAPNALFSEEVDDDDLLDAWWTLVVYHGSLKSVGNSHNAFVTDVRDFGRRLAGELKESRKSGHGGESENEAKEVDIVTDRSRNLRIAQLTSRRTAQENAETFRNLAHDRNNDECIDAVLATNMVSVGLDVARLALMIMNGQPLTTAEYIQASSRVGRAEVPGLVLSNYLRHQARSLSHYETFRPYHESFYRFVEPTSVTPHTYQVRTRALHAALVIAVRHACPGLGSNGSAGNFDKDAPHVRAVIEELKRRCRLAASEPEHGQETASHIDRLAGEWHAEARRCENDSRQLKYEVPQGEKNADRLLYTHGDTRRGLWATLHSMRNVESTGQLRVHDWPSNDRSNT